VVMSIMTYNAPVWGQEFADSPGKQHPLRRVQRMTALRVICAYSFAGGGFGSGWVPSSSACAEF